MAKARAIKDNNFATPNQSDTDLIHKYFMLRNQDFDALQTEVNNYISGLYAPNGQMFYINSISYNSFMESRTGQPDTPWHTVAIWLTYVGGPNGV